MEMRAFAETTTMVSSTVLIILAFISTIIPAAISQHIVKSLPGYPGDLPFTLETGYVGVGEFDELQLFYYFVESERNPNKDPLLLWINGGPGCSAFSGLVYEMGPLTFNYTDYDGSLPNFLINEYSWTKVANIIFIDQPVGTGFSYSTTSEGYSDDDDDTSVPLNIYQFLRKWLINHPKFLKNPLYITGDSYGGFWVPLVVHHIVTGNEVGLKPKMNIEGYTIGNPAVDVDKDINARVPYAYRVGLLSEDLYESVKKHCNGNYVDVDPKNTNCVRDIRVVSNCLAYLYTANILEPNCKSFSPNLLTSRSLADRNFLMEEDPNVLVSSDDKQVPAEPWCRNYHYILSYVWANDEKVQTALGVRKDTITEWIRCNKTLSQAYTFSLDSNIEYQQNLTKKYMRVLVYSGDQDITFPYVGTQEWIKYLNITTSDYWRPWVVDGQVAGYTTKYEDVPYELTFATIKGAGHTAPEYKPKECFSMISRWLAYYQL